MRTFANFHGCKLPHICRRIRCLAISGCLGKSYNIIAIEYYNRLQVVHSSMLVLGSVISLVEKQYSDRVNFENIYCVYVSFCVLLSIMEVMQCYLVTTHNNISKGHKFDAKELLYTFGTVKASWTFEITALSYMLCYNGSFYHMQCLVFIAQSTFKLIIIFFNLW